MKLKPVIGLEIHIELSTKSKMFCGCAADHFGKQANTQVCPTCLGLPGAMPRANRQAVLDTILLGRAFECEINKHSHFDRKHYFYPDLPKGYQISQYSVPLCSSGNYQKVKIRRIHLEEDTGKLVHTKVNGERASLVDFNRSGVPLVEMVTEPDFDDVKSAVEFLKEVQLIVRYLDVSSADMEKGSMRLEANVSLSGDGSLPNYKVELKNINSFRFLKKALEFEIERQGEILKAGKDVEQETRGYDSASNTTFSQRSKEGEQDYRYFAEPDLPSVFLTPEELKSSKEMMPELPGEKRERFKKEYDLSGQYAEVLVSSSARAKYFEEALGLAKDKLDNAKKKISEVMVNQNMDLDFSEPAGLVKKLVELSKSEYVSREEVEKAAQKVIRTNEKAVSEYKSGKTQVIGFLIGQVQKELDGKGEPRAMRSAIASLLD